MDFELGRSIEVLGNTPGVLRSMVSGLSDDWTASSGDQENWGVFDVVGHLVHADEAVWIPRAKVILAQGEDRNFPSFDRFGQFENAKGKTIEVLLDEFDEVRRKSLETIQGWSLTDEQLGLPGIHPEFGDVNLRQLLATWTVHDLTHIRQIAMVMARKYEQAVGPWKAYLSILD